jgi:hypothetical protein
MRILSALLLIAAAFAAQGKDKSLLRNGSFEIVSDRGRPDGWVLKQHAGVRAYETSVVTDQAYKGKQSLRLTRINKQVWGKIEQFLDAKPLIGKTVEFKIAVRSENVGKKGFTVWIAGFEGSNALQISKSERVTGTTDWTVYTQRLEVPEYSRMLFVAVNLDDAGTLWLDDASLKIVDADSAPK